MKRAGKLFLMIILVLAMVLTSTGVSNIMSVFAETQSVEESKEKASTSTGTEEQQKSKQPSSEKDGKKEEDAAESTTASKAKEETTSKKEETTTQEASTEAKKKKEEVTTQEKKAESTTAVKKKTAKSKKAESTTVAKKKTTTSGISTQSSSNENIVEQQDEESENSVENEVFLDKYISAKESGIQIEINGQLKSLEEIRKDNIKVPKGAKVEIALKYGAISNLTENTKLVYQLPDEITIKDAQNGPIMDGRITAGSYTITTEGKIILTFNKDYLDKHLGKIEGGTVTVAGEFKEGWGGTPGGDKIIFGETEVTIPFEENQVVTKAKISLDKTIEEYNKNDNAITYQVKVEAPSDNTQDVPDVRVEDKFITNGDKLSLIDGKKYQIVTISNGTTFDTGKGKWIIGTMKPGDSCTLKYKVKIKNTFFNNIADVNEGISNTATAYSGNTNMGEKSVTQSFNNNLNITKSNGGVVIENKNTGKAYIIYTVTVEAPENNTNDMTNVVVDDVFFSGEEGKITYTKEEVKSYLEFKAEMKDTGGKLTPLPDPVADTTNKTLKWTIGTMKPGSTATLTYKVELQDDVWESGSEWRIKKDLKNTATVNADNMDKKEAVTTVKLRKVWIWKSADKGWDANKDWSNGNGKGLLRFTIHANESTDGGPVLKKNFLFTDKLSGNYVYDGKVIIRAYKQGPDEKGDAIGTAELDVDGKTDWNYTPTGDMIGPYFYELEYYARPKTAGHGGAISNTAGIGVVEGRGFYHEVTWKGTGNDNYSLNKKYLGGVGVGAAKWKTTIPSNVYAGVRYEDNLYNAWYNSNAKPSSYHTFTQKQLDEIIVKNGDRTFERGKHYDVVPVFTTIDGEQKRTGYKLTFKTDTENVTQSNPITIEYESTPNISGVSPGSSRKFENSGRIYYTDGLYLTANASATYTQYGDFSKSFGTYDASKKQLTWYLTLNENSKMTGDDASIEEELPEGLKFISAEIGNGKDDRGSEATGTTISSSVDAKNSQKVTINVKGLVSNNEKNRNGFIRIKIVTEVTDESFLLKNASQTFTNSAVLKYNGSSYTASADATIENKSLSKDAIYNTSTYPYINYAVKVNPNGYNLLEEQYSINVVDQMTEDMILMEDTVEVSSKGQKLPKDQWTLINDTQNHLFTVTVPDDREITITYQVSINKPVGEKVTLVNRAWYEGHEQRIENIKKDLTVHDSSATVEGKLYLYVKKKDLLTKDSLSGAEFALAQVVRSSDGSIVYDENGEPKLSNEITATTTADKDKGNEDGEAIFEITQPKGDTQPRVIDQLYCLYEKKAPSNYKKTDKKFYLAFKTQSNTGNLTVQYVQSGGAIEIANTPVGSLTITKKVIGNVIPDKDKNNGYQMKITPSKDNQDQDLSKVSVKVGKEVKIEDGSLTFYLKENQTATITGLPTGTYNVTENVDTAGRTDKTTYNVSYSGDNEAIEVKKGETSDVTVTNTYKTQLYIQKKDTASDISLTGAKLAVYKADAKGNKVSDEAVDAWSTSESNPRDLTGKVVAGGRYVLIETEAPADYEKAASIPFTVKEDGTIDGIKDNTIVLDNKKKTGSLTVKKIIEDGEADTAFDFTVTFTSFNNGKGGDVTVTRKGKEGKDQTTTETVTPDTDGKLKLELKALTNNETVKISGIPYGTSYTVKEAQQEGYLETANSNLTGVIGDNGTVANDTKPEVNAEASITNTRLTGFTVKKSVEYGQYTPDAETKDKKQFKFKVTLTRKEQPYTGKFKLQYSDDKNNNNNKENAAPEVNADSPGVYTIQLKDTQTATFSDLPSGTKYTVEEVADANYDASVKVNKNVAATAEGTIDKTGDTVEFTNTRKHGAFSFTKTVKGNTQDKEQAYGFYVEVDGKPFNSNAAITDGTTAKITDGKLSLKDGQTATIENIPSGVSYRIKETTGDRYVTLINNKVTAETTGTVEEGKTTETQFVNQVIHLNVTKTDLTGQKEVAGATMTLYKAEDVNEDGTVKDGAEVLDSWVSGKESFHDFGPAVKAGESYVLIETAAPDGYAYAENITFTVNEDGTIKTDAEKITDKETGDDIYLVKDDVTRVSVKKMDITGQKEVAGARLLLKDKDGNVIESWMSTTEAHVFEQKLIAGETYTLTEVTAPSGYEVAADITFTVNKDGTVSVDGKAVDGNEIVMKDETTPVGEEGKLVVSKLVTFQGRNQAVNRTFYVALFSDADCTKKVSNVKELKCEGAWSAYTVFEHLKNGTYYVAETDEDGNKLESSEACKIEGNGTKCAITPTQKTAYAVIENQLLIPGDDFLNTLHDLTITKNVTLDGNPISDKYNGTFYVSLFTDPYYTNRIDDVKALQIQNGKSTSVSFIDLADGTYYVAETDKDGNPVENTDFGFDVTYDGDIAVSFTEENTDSTLGITNDMNERNPEYDKYLKEKDDNNGDNDKNKNNTSNHSSNKTTKKGKNSKTGDYSHILFYAALAAAALVVGSAEMYRRMYRAARRKNKHDR